MKIQIITITSDIGLPMLPGHCYLLNKYLPPGNNEFVPMHIICGFSEPDLDLPSNFKFVSLGKFEDYPANRWSNALIKILDTIADEVFLLLLDDYWLIRQTDTKAIRMMHDYCHQFQNVIKFDVTTDRLFADGGGKYLFGYNTYDTLGYLDLIKSDFGSAYHLSLWGGLWRRDLLRRFLIPGETAQQIEINGTARLSQAGDELLVLGTRQSPLKHANVIQRGAWNQDSMTGLPALKPHDLQELRDRGYLND